MKRKGLLYAVTVIAFVGLLAVSQPAWAWFILPSWGAETSSWITLAPSYWLGGGLWASDGGAGLTSAYSSLSDFRGSTKSSSMLQATGPLTPILRSDASIVTIYDTWGAWGKAFAVEEYTYTGAAQATLTLNTSLTGAITNPYEGNALNSTGIYASIYVLNSQNFYYSMSIGTLLYESGVTEKGHVDYGMTATGSYNQSQEIAFSVTPGETFYVWAMLDTLAQWTGTSADAYSTLTMSFDNNNDLRAHAAVPLPPSLLLLAPGLAGLAALRLRRR